MTSSAHAPLTLELKDEGGQDELSVRRRGHRRRRRREGNFAPIVFLHSFSCLPKVALNQFVLLHLPFAVGTSFIF